MKVELLQIKKIINRKTILDLAHLCLEQGKIYAVVGPNGAGKTTLLRIISGVDQGRFGRIYYDGAAQPPSHAIAYMPQNTYLFDLSVGENVRLGLTNRKASPSEVKARVHQALERVGMVDYCNAKARTLSGGEQQRVALARTLAACKQLVILDEPFSATDLAGVELVENYLKTVNTADHATVVFTTHNPAQVVRIADEVLVMDNGRIVEQGDPASVLYAPSRPETRDFIKNWRLEARCSQ